MSRAQPARIVNGALRVVPQATELRDDDLVLRMSQLDTCRHPLHGADRPNRPAYLLSAEISDLRLERRAPPMQIVVVGDTMEIRFEHHASDSAGANEDYRTQGWRYRPTAQSQALLGAKFVELLIVND